MRGFSNKKICPFRLMLSMWMSVRLSVGTQLYKAFSLDSTFVLANQVLRYNCFQTWFTRITIGNSCKVKPDWPVSSGKSKISFIQLDADRLRHNSYDQSTKGTIRRWTCLRWLSLDRHLSLTLNYIVYYSIVAGKQFDTLQMLSDK